LQAPSAWQSSAYILAYDEHGRYFDHVAPPQFGNLMECFAF